MMEVLTKILSKVDVGDNSKQSGIVVSKDREILSFFPTLDESIKNPREALLFVDDDGNDWPFNYIHYNNKIVDDGTRDEYRLTGTTAFMRANSYRQGERIYLWKEENGSYRIGQQIAERLDGGYLTESTWKRIDLKTSEVVLEDSEGLDISLEDEKYAEDREEWDVKEGEIASSTNIRVIRSDYSVYELYRKYKKQPIRLMLDVSFQRASVWNMRQKCELIESVLLGLPIPVFYFRQEQNASLSVVDGKQRLNALFTFMEDDFKLKGLEILTFLNGKKFSDLTGELGIYQTQLEDYQIYSHLIMPPTPDRYVFEIFGRVNRGGTKLNRQEIRNAMYQGKGLEMMRRVVQSEAFSSVTGISYEKDRRMKTMYMLNRFIAFYFERNGYLQIEENGVQKPYRYDGHMDEFLGKTLRRLNAMQESMLGALERKIIEVLKVARETMGLGAFRRYMHEEYPLNLNLFEIEMCWLTTVIKKNNYEYMILREALNKAAVDEKFNEVLNRSRDNIRDVNNRFSRFYEVANKTK